jgi:hypothetical protein
VPSDRLEIDHLLAWLDNLKVRMLPLELQRRVDIIRKIDEVELRVDWWKYASEHRREHATKAYRDDITKNIGELVGGINSDLIE